MQDHLGRQRATTQQQQRRQVQMYLQVEPRPDTRQHMWQYWERPNMSHLQELSKIARWPSPCLNDQVIAASWLIQRKLYDQVKHSADSIGGDGLDPRLSQEVGR